MKKLPLIIINLLFLLSSAISVTALLPTITLNNPIDYYNTSTTSITFNFTANSSDTLLTCNLTINNIANITYIAATNGTPQINITNNFNDGLYYWNVTCWDSLNNTNTSVTRKFSIDTVAPTTNLNGTSTKSLNAGQTAYIWANWADATTGVKNVELIVNGFVNKTNTIGLAAGSEATYNFSYITSISQIGSTLNFTINATDYARNENSTALLQVAVVDGSSPNLILVSPIDGHNSSNTNLTLQFNVTDNYASTVYCNITVDGVVNTTQSDTAIISNTYKNFTTLITDLSDSTHYWNVTCWDSAGNKNISVTRMFSIDTVPPIISNLRNTSTTNENSYIEFNCDENCNYSISWYDSNGGVGSFNNNTFATSHKPYLSSLTNSTTYVINLTVLDIVGNKAVNNTFNFTTAKSIIADTTPPITSLDAPSNITSNLTLLFADFSDSESGFVGNIILNELSDHSSKKNITFNSSENQAVYLYLQKSANVTSITMDLRGYNYSNYVYDSFEDENLTSGIGLGQIFGSGNSTIINPDIYIETIPLNFTANRLGMYYRCGDGAVVYHYSIKTCPIDENHVCSSSLTTLVADYPTVYSGAIGEVLITLEDNFTFLEGSEYKIELRCLNKVYYGSEVYSCSQYVGNAHCFAATGLSDHDLYSWGSANDTFKFKIYSTPTIPNSPSIDFGNDSVYEWTYSGKLGNATTNSNLSNATNDYLATCEADSEGYCSVPLVFDSQSVGILELSNINVMYLGNNSCEVCIASDGACDTEWTNNNLTNYYSSDYLSGNCSYSWNASNYNDGIYNVSLRIKDTTYNTGVSSKKITLDRTAPLFTYMWPQDNIAYNINKSNPTNMSPTWREFASRVSDLSPIANCSLIINNKINRTQSNVGEVLIFNINLSTVFSGSQIYTWSIFCSDVFGHEMMSDTRKFTFIAVGNFSGETIDLTTVNISSIDNLTLEVPTSGKIKFLDIVNLSGVPNIEDYVKISWNRIEVNSTALPTLNKTSTLYLYNLTYDQTPRILRDNGTCPDTICKIVNYSNGTLIFNVTQFSVYTTEDAPADSGSSGSGSSGGSSGGGGGGSGGGGLTFVCNMDWQCGEWSECLNGLQARQCDFVKVPQHVSEQECPSQDKPPVTSQKCEVAKKIKSIAEKEVKEDVGKQKEVNQDKQNQITGMAVKQAPKPNKLTAFVIFVFIVSLGGFFYYKLFRLRT